MLKTLAGTHKILTEAILTELDVGLTLLDAAAITSDRTLARKSVNRAITALRTAEKLLSEIDTPPAIIELVQKRRLLLAQRLRAFSGLV